MDHAAINEALQRAVGHHQAGRLAEAEGLYRRVLEHVPAHADANHLLGVLALQLGHLDAAITLLGRASAIDPGVPAYHSNLGEACRRAGQGEQALESLRRAIALDPHLLTAHYNLGLALYEMGRLDEAVAVFLRVISLAPERAEAHNLLGAAFYQLGRYDEAIAACGRAVALRPAFAEAYSNLGNALRDRGRLDEALAALEKAVALRPDLASLHSNLSNALKDKGRFEEAIAAARQAIALAPALAEAHSNLGNALRDKGRFDEAIAACRQAIALKPDLAVAHCNLGNALGDKGRYEEAVAACRQAIALGPELAEAHSNLGNALRDLWRLDEAVACCRRAITLKPELAEAHYSLASALLLQGDHEEAHRAYHSALALRPDSVRAHSSLLMFEQYRSGASLAGLARSHADWDARHAAVHHSAAPPPDCDRDRDRDPERPLRLGVVSPDLRRHPVGFLLAGVLENLRAHPGQRVCYHSWGIRDEVSARLAAAADEWHEVLELTDAELAAKIRADRIDILFDLAGHTSGHRLLVFARRPAPIQISWMGYVGTTGLRAMDYLLADRYHVPPDAEAHYCETVLRMPDDYLCFDPPAEAPAVGPLPALERGHVTFGCFNNMAKLTPEVLALWAEIVRRVPGSRLLLISPGLGTAAVGQRIGDAFAAAGADRAQLELRGRQTRHDLLAAYNTIDLALDTFPYSGGLTTCEALWMGVPVVTRPGETFAGRHTLSHLSNAGVSGTVARDPREYVELAVRLAVNLPHLAARRAGLREQMARSPLCDGPRFANHLMALLREAWRRHCRA